jgi:DMSO reductase family type II enzyme heme b subunit
MTITRLMALGLATALVSSLPAAADDGLLARRVGIGKLPLDPRSPQWQSAKAVDVGILPQTVTTPQNAKPAVDKLKVRSIHNGAEIAFLIEWKDNAADDTARSGQFTDAVALELPLDGIGNTSPMMGATGHQNRVNILQWRAEWQREVNKGETTARGLFPNMVNDAETSAVYKGSDKDLYSPAKVIGNFSAQGPNGQPVMDLMAEGFGSLTPRIQQSASGNGIWDKGTWRVVICRPLASITGSGAAPLTPGKATSVGFAVWNGGQGERGARKGWAPWVPLMIEK